MKEQNPDEAILTEDEHPVNVALRDNDVYDWAPISDTRLLYCEGDDQVAFENSIIARDKMVENGAQMVQAVELNPNFNHTQCVTPAATSFVFFLLVFAEATSTEDPGAIAFDVFPNPAYNGVQIVINDLQSKFDIEILDMSGMKRIEVKDIYSGSYVDFDLPAGMYVLSIKDGNGKPVGVKRIVKM